MQKAARRDGAHIHEGGVPGCFLLGRGVMADADWGCRWFLVGVNKHAWFLESSFRARPMRRLVSLLPISVGNGLVHRKLPITRNTLPVLSEHAQRAQRPSLALTFLRLVLLVVHEDSLEVGGLALLLAWLVAEHLGIDTCRVVRDGGVEVRVGAGL